MNIRQLVNTYLDSRGLKIKEANEGDFSPLLPLILMDSAYQEFNKFVRPIKCRHEMKKIKNEWIATYNAFNKDYFRCYDEEMTDELCTLMDECEKALLNDILITKVACMKLCEGEEFERKQVLSVCMLLDIIISLCRLIWQRCYKDGYPKDWDNPYLKQMDYLINRWKNLYHEKGETINPNNSKDIERAIDALVKNTMKFLHEYYV